jgi:hypothetical protein
MIAGGIPAGGPWDLEAPIGKLAHIIAWTIRHLDVRRVGVEVMEQSKISFKLIDRCIFMNVDEISCWVLLVIHLTICVLGIR